MEAEQERGATQWAVGEEVKPGAPTQGPALGGGAGAGARVGQEFHVRVGSRQFGVWR